MKKIALILNNLLLLFTGLVLLTDGFPVQAAYIVFTVWILLTLVLSSYVMSRNLSSLSAFLKMIAFIGNIVLLGFIFWALADKYPHPEEPGFIPYTVLAALTPVLNIIVLFHSWKDIGRILHLKSKPL